MPETNPYQAPAPALDRRSSTSALRTLVVRWLKGTAAVAAFVYPIWVVGICFFTYWVAWNELGTQPVCGRDDPKHIEGIKGLYRLSMSTLRYFFPLGAGSLILVGLSRKAKAIIALVSFEAVAFLPFLYVVIWLYD